MDDVMSLFDRLPDAKAREQLVMEFRPLVVKLARRYSHRGQDLEDLTQVAMIGLLNAIDRFDPNHGTRFVSFAIPTITGELKRHFRDSAWSVNVPRRMKEISLSARRANQELSQKLGRSPTVEEIAEATGWTTDEVTEAASLATAYCAETLESPTDDSWGPRDTIGSPDAEIDRFDEIEMLRPVLLGRSDRELEILYLRFYEELTQRQIAARVGMSQMNVSRVISLSLEKMRPLLQP